MKSKVSERKLLCLLSAVDTLQEKFVPLDALKRYLS